jgi:DNA-binding response OmpR family regulator
LIGQLPARLAVTFPPGQTDPPQPPATTAEARTSPPKVPSPKSADVKLPLVLLIESNPDLGLHLKQLLGHQYKIVEAGDDRDGRDKAHGLVPDIIIADIFLPQVDGVRLCQEIKSAQLTSHIPVILLNTADVEDCQLKALEAGADDYISKAFNLSLLQARVENLLASRRKLRMSFHQPSVSQPRDLAVNQADAHFLQRTLTAIEQNLSDFEFDVEALARSVAVSRRQLFRKLKAVVDLSPKALIRSVRLKRAAQLLLESEMTVTEITFAAGFQDVKHFRALFKEQFGVLPSEYLKSVVPPRSMPNDPAPNGAIQP